MTNRPYLRNLNGLRFIAASYTIFFHYWSFPGHPALSKFFTHGHISVPFFFLLSGFVLSYSYHDYSFFEGRSNRNYILNRFIRLAPIYYLAMFLALPLLIRRQLDLPLTFTENVSFTSAHLILAQSLIPLKKLMGFWNIHSWSLSVEMFLYLCSPLILFKLNKMTLKQGTVALFAMFCLNTILFALTFTPVELLNRTSPFFSPYFLPTFITGAILAKIYIYKYEKIKEFSSYIFVSTSLVLLMILFAGLDKSFYSSFNPVFQIGFSLLILSSCSETITNRFLGGRVMFFLGEISYAMYIFQAPVKTATQQFLSKVLGFYKHDGLVYSLTIYLSIIFVSAIVTVFIDPKARNFMKKKLIKTEIAETNS